MLKKKLVQNTGLLVSDLSVINKNKQWRVNQFNISNVDCQK
jgi:hypothetical protein